MSEAYEDDLANEQAIMEQIERSNRAYQERHSAPPVSSRSHKANPIKLVAWRQARGASIKATAERWKVSEATVKRWCKDYGEAAKLERARWEGERLDREAEVHAYQYAAMYYGQRNKHLSFIDMEWIGKCERAKGTDQEALVAAAREAALNKADDDFRENWVRCIGPLPGDLG